MADMGDYDPDAKAPSFEPLPVGEYMVQISESASKEIEAGKNRINLTMVVLEPEQYAGKKIFDGFFVRHPKPDVMAINNGIKNSIVAACGYKSVSDSAELHNIPFKVKTKIDPAKVDGATGKAYDAQTKVAKYFPHGGIPEAAPATRAAPTPANGTAPAKVMPWQNK
jgi:hypothetical protein